MYFVSCENYNFLISNNIFISGKKSTIVYTANEIKHPLAKFFLSFSIMEIKNNVTKYYKHKALMEKS